jgi:cell division protein FtsX
LNDTITIKVKQAKNKRSLERHHNHKGKTKKTTKDPLNDTIIIKVKQTNNKRSIERHHNHQGKTNKQQKIP